MVVLQTCDRSHAAVVEQRDHAAYTVLDTVDQDLRVHHKRSVPRKGDAVFSVLDVGRAKQGRARKAHEGRACFGEGLTGRIVFDDLETVGLHIACVKKLDRAFGVGKGRHRVDRRRFGQDRLLPDLIRHGCCF